MVKPFDNDEFGFAFEEGEATPESQRTPQEYDDPNPVPQLPRPKPAQTKEDFWMGDTQIALLAGMLIIQCCILIGFGVVYFLHPIIKLTSPFLSIVIPAHNEESRLPRTVEADFCIS